VYQKSLHNDAATELIKEEFYLERGVQWNEAVVITGILQHKRNLFTHAFIRHNHSAAHFHLYTAAIPPTHRMFTFRSVLNLRNVRICSVCNILFFSTIFCGLLARESHRQRFKTSTAR
jgi:hypothetical protein